MPVFVLAALALTTADIVISTETYRGWPGATRVSNGVVDIVVVPQIGRVMRYGYVGNRNFLWENLAFSGEKPGKSGEYANYGGDKLWPAPQSIWNWPPDPGIDGPAHTLERIPGGVRLTSPVGTKVKVRFVREITLDPITTEVRFRNRMENRADRQELAVWQVTQIIDPDLVEMPFVAAGGNKLGWHGYGDERLKDAYQKIRPGKLLLSREPSTSRKFGTYSPTGTLVANFGSNQMITKAKVIRGRTYVDKNSPLQVYLNQDPDKYVELEHTSPLDRMARGESALLEVTWRLASVPPAG